MNDPVRLSWGELGSVQVFDEYVHAALQSEDLRVEVSWVGIACCDQTLKHVHEKEGLSAKAYKKKQGR